MSEADNPEAGKRKLRIVLASLLFTEQARSRQLLSYFLTEAQVYKAGLEKTDTKVGNN